eukprot:SM003188S11883  [mRNA]  locus=s3188:130:1399:+ [translate_table: standard]
MPPLPSRWTARRLDDPLLWGRWRLPGGDPKLCRWTLTAKDICFTNPAFSYFFRLGKCIPVVRGGGIHQPAIQEAIDVVNAGDWLHTFPEGKVEQRQVPLARLKWGVGSIIARAAVPPLVICVAHSGFEKVMPEKHLFGRRALVPLPGKHVTVVVGEPLHFDVPLLRQQAAEAVARGEWQPEATAAPEDVMEAAAEPSSKTAALTEEDFADPSKEVEKPMLHAARVIDDLATQSLHSRITAMLRDNLQRLLLEAHRLTNERCGARLA